MYFYMKLSRLFSNNLKIYNIKIHNYISYWKFWGAKNIDRIWFLADCKIAQYEIQHNLRFLIFMIFKYLKQSKNHNRRYDNYILPQNSSVIYNYVFLCYLDYFQII